MSESAVNPHRKGILVIQIILWILVGLMFLGQFAFYLPVSLILVQPNTQPPLPPTSQVVFLAMLIADCVLVIPAFLALQYFVPRWMKRKGKSFGAHGSQLHSVQALCMDDSGGDGVFCTGLLPDQACILAVRAIFDSKPGSAGGQSAAAPGSENPVACRWNVMVRWLRRWSRVFWCKESR